MYNNLEQIFLNKILKKFENENIQNLIEVVY